MLSNLRSLLHRSIPSLRNPRFPRLSFSTGNDDDDWTKPPPPAAGAGDDSWGEITSWSTGLTKAHYDGAAIGRHVADVPPSETPRESLKAMDEVDDVYNLVESSNKEDREFVNSWDKRMMETYKLLKQVREPGARGEYLKDSEKKEMYRLHKENPEEYTVERLAKDYRIMRQRVHAILWLKEMEEEEEKKLGKPLDDSVEILLDNFPESR